MGFLYSEICENGRRKKKYLGGLIKKIKSDNKKEVFVFGVRVFCKRLLSKNFPSSETPNPDDVQVQKSEYINTAMGKLERDAHNFWNNAKEDALVQDYSHYRNVGRWNDLFWFNAGEDHRRRIISFLAKFDVLFLEKIKSKSALEWGVGGGVNIRILCEMFNRVDMVDISKANLEESSKQMDNFNLSNYASHHIDTSYYSELEKFIPLNSVDFLMCVAVFQHMPSKEYVINVVKFMYRLLNENSYAILQTRRDDGSELFKQKSENYNENVINFTSFATDDFKNILAEIGFIVLDVEINEQANYDFFYVTKNYNYFETYLKNEKIFIKGQRGIPSGEKSQKSKNDLNYKMEQGFYTTEKTCCLCSFSDSLEIAHEDRYSIALTTVICKKCGLLRSSPYYTNETLIQFYDNEYRNIYVQNQNLEDFFTQQISFGENIKTHTSQFFEPSEGKFVYEIGCGAGGILVPFMNAGASVKGVDYGNEYLGFGREKGLDLMEGSVAELCSFQKADLVIINHVLEHVVDIMTFLKDIRTIINKDTGLLYVAVPTIEIISPVYNNDIYIYLQNAHVWNFSNSNLKYILECCGYEVVMQSEMGYCICRLSDENKKIEESPWLFAENMLKLVHYEQNFIKHSE